MPVPKAFAAGLTFLVLLGVSVVLGQPASAPPDVRKLDPDVTVVRLLGPPEADGEYVVLRGGSDGDAAEDTVHLHDYARVYGVPWLYEHVVQDLLGCRSPQVVAQGVLVLRVASIYKKPARRRVNFPATDSRLQYRSTGVNRAPAGVPGSLNVVGGLRLALFKEIPHTL